MGFIQAPPELAPQFEDDRVLRRFLERQVPAEVLSEITPSLKEMGELAAGRLYELAIRHRNEEPQLTSWDPWGNRIDHLEVNTAWKEYAKVAAEKGVVGTAYERKHGAYSRIHQFALMYLFAPSTQVYTCPLAMTDGAAKNEVFDARERTPLSVGAALVAPVGYGENIYLRNHRALPEWFDTWSDAESFVFLRTVHQDNKSNPFMTGTQNTLAPPEVDLRLRESFGMKLGQLKRLK